VTSGDSPIVAMRHFSKAFDGQFVLRDVSLNLLAGEVHGLVGQNGSGKSTMIKILSGFHAPEREAELEVRGTRIALPLKPGDARRLGIAFVHQDLGLIESATVLENVGIGRYKTQAAWRINWRRERDHVDRVLREFGLASVSPERLVSSLKEVDRALVAIIRSLDELRDVSQGFLVLDEPTPYLPRNDVEHLFRVVREIAQRGTGVLFVSHRLEEVKSVTDTVSVLRDGALIKTAATSTLSEKELIELILGFSLDELYPSRHQAPGSRVLSARGVTCDGLTDFALDLRAGEIVGLTGLLRMGYEKVPYALFGAEERMTGFLEVAGRSHDMAAFAPRKAIQHGIVLVPADRLRDSGVNTASVFENLTLPTLHRYFLSGVLRHRRERAEARSALAAFDVRPRDPGRAFGTLSGGNQQKVLLAKWLGAKPRILLLHEPTQGVDVGARSEIFATLRSAADAGLAVVLASTEYDDLAHLCDRVLVFRDGRVVREIDRQNLTADRIAAEALRSSEEAVADGLGAPDVRSHSSDRGVGE
jgi:ribose transport system ATP-binding protein